MAPSGKPKTPPASPRQDSARDMRRAVIEDADKTDVKDRDRVHGDGESLGLETSGDLNRGKG